jgi:hypothetical protein
MNFLSVFSSRDASGRNERFSTWTCIAPAGCRDDLEDALLEAPFLQQAGFLGIGSDASVSLDEVVRFLLRLVSTAILSSVSVDSSRSSCGLPFRARSGKDTS